MSRGSRGAGGSTTCSSGAVTTARRCASRTPAWPCTSRWTVCSPATTTGCSPTSDPGTLRCRTRPAAGIPPAGEGLTRTVTRVKKVVVLDYGSGNLRSAERALARVGADVEVTSDSRAALDADGLVVPGVGAFAACMAGLRAVDGPRLIGSRLAGGRPVLGICVGMQVLFDRGVEHGHDADGCGEWPGVVEQLRAPVLPHMGWNTVEAPEKAVL